MTTFVQMSKWHVPALLKYILSWFMFTYSFFVNLERDKSKAHCQNRLVIHIYRILLLTKFSNVLLFWRFYFSLKNLHSSDKFCCQKKKNYSIKYIWWIYEECEEFLSHDRGLLIKEPIFQFIKKNLNAWISAKLGHIKK